METRGYGLIAPYLSADELHALAAPDQHLVLAAATAGRLLRSGDGRKIGRQAILQWLATLSAADLAVVGGSAEQSAIDALSKLRQATTLPPGWLRQAITERDDAESLLVVLGVAALEHPSDAAGDAAAVWERRCRKLCDHVDTLASVIAPLLSDELRGAHGSAWLDRIERIDPSPWWLSLPLR